MPTSRPSPTATAGSARAWLRRLGVAIALAFGVWLLVIAANRSETGLERGGDDPIVAERFPLADAQAPSQTQIGVTLEPGFEGTLSIDGIVIPEAQLDGALDPATTSAELIRQHGLRPNNRNRIWFTPGPGKVIDELPTGEMTITVTYHRERQPGVDTGSSSWRVTIV